jgi:hypothetical protein
VQIKHYHCNNGRFADTLFCAACDSQNQKLTFCGVNAHFQNGIAKRAIQDLLESTRKQLLHAQQQWSQAVSTALWPYALRHAAYLSNVLPTHKDGQSRPKLFSGIRVGSNMRFFAHIWLSCVCTAQLFGFEQIYATMGSKSMHWAEFRTKSYART